MNTSCDKRKGGVPVQPGKAAPVNQPRYSSSLLIQLTGHEAMASSMHS